MYRNAVSHTLRHVQTDTHIYIWLYVNVWYLSGYMAPRINNFIKRDMFVRCNLIFHVPWTCCRMQDVRNPPKEEDVADKNACYNEGKQTDALLQPTFKELNPVVSYLCLPIRLPAHRSVCLIRLFLCLPGCLHSSLSASMSVYLFLDRSVSGSASLSIRISN